MAISFFQCILYRDLYHWFKFHGYNKTESVEILEQCTLRGIVVALKDSNKKLSARQIKKITTEYNAAHPNFNVSLSPEVREKAEEFMHEHFGLEYTESGRRTNMTAAFLSMLEAAAKQKKVKLKLVA